MTWECSSLPLPQLRDVRECDWKVPRLPGEQGRRMSGQLRPGESASPAARPRCGKCSTPSSFALVQAGTQDQPPLGPQGKKKCVPCADQALCLACPDNLRVCTECECVLFGHTACATVCPNNGSASPSCFLLFTRPCAPTRKAWQARKGTAPTQRAAAHGAAMRWKIPLQTAPRARKWTPPRPSAQREH